MVAYSVGHLCDSSYFLCFGLFCCVFVPGTLTFHLLLPLLHCDLSLSCLTVCGHRTNTSLGYKNQDRAFGCADVVGYVEEKERLDVKTTQGSVRYGTYTIGSTLHLQ